jgi:hypothetical protein
VDSPHQGRFGVDLYQGVRLVESEMLAARFLVELDIGQRIPAAHQLDFAFKSFWCPYTVALFYGHNTPLVNESRGADYSTAASERNPSDRRAGLCVQLVQGASTRVGEKLSYRGRRGRADNGQVGAFLPRSHRAASGLSAPYRSRLFSCARRSLSR